MPCKRKKAKLQRGARVLRLVSLAVRGFKRRNHNLERQIILKEKTLDLEDSRSAAWRSCSWDQWKSDILHLIDAYLASKDMLSG